MMATLSGDLTLYGRGNLLLKPLSLREWHTTRLSMVSEALRNRK
jgi:hypothetical protein